jgi:ankyrin repeat protein
MKLLLEMFDEPVDRGHVLLAKNGSKESVLHVAAASGAAASIACIRQHVVARGFASSAARQLFVQEILEQRNSMDFSPVLIASCSDEGPTLQALVDLVAAAEHPRKSAALQCHCVRQKTTAVSLSLSCGAAASAKVLLAALAEASADEQKAVLLAVNDDGNTCLMAAVESGNLEALHVLLAAPMLVSATQQIREALHHRNRSGRTLCEIVDGQCGMRRSAMSLPNSPLKSMTSTFSAVEWEGVDPSVVLFATREVCTCERRRACNAKAAHAMIISSVAPRPRSHGPAPSLDL